MEAGTGYHVFPGPSKSAYACAYSPKAMLAITLLLLPRAQSGQALIDAAFAAMGGKDKLASIAMVKAEVVGHQFMPEQSERPEGPWFNTYYDGTATADFVKGTDANQYKVHGILFPQAGDQNATYDLAGGKRQGFAYPSSMPSSAERMVLGPENLLFAASSAKDLRVGPETTYHDVPHDVLTFTWGAVPVRVLLNRYTHLPAAVETKNVGQGFWSVWGDVTERTVFGNWDIAPGGIFYPTLWAREYNDLQQDNFTLTKVEVTYGQPRDAAWGQSFAPLVRNAPRQITFKAVDVAPGIVQYQSGFNCAVVDQGDGLVLLEGVVSSPYVKKVEEDLATRFPGKKLKAVVSTDDAWPHIGGLRQTVAEGIPLYALPQNKKILDRLFKAPHTLEPDDLQMHARKANYRLVDQRVSLGKGDNAIEIYPMHGAGAERMLFAYFPAKKLIYAPDVIQTAQGQWFSLNLLKQLVDAVDREGLKPETAFAFHSGPVSFQMLRNKVNEALAAK